MTCTLLIELADLVEEERAAVGDLEEALPVGIGAGEGPLAVAEQLALDEVLRQGPAIDGDEGTVRPSALVVQVAGDQFLARAGLAQDHHGGVGRGDGLDQAADLLHGGGLADQHGRAFGGLQAGLQRGGLVRHVAALGDAGEDDLELGPLARLGQVVEGPQPQGLHGRVDRGVAGQDDDLRLGADLADLAQDLDAGEPGHPQIEQRGVVQAPFQAPAARRSRPGRR